MAEGSADPPAPPPPPQPRSAPSSSQDWSAERERFTADQFLLSRVGVKVKTVKSAASFVDPRPEFWQ